jgi:hypothetical protein
MRGAGGAVVLARPDADAEIARVLRPGGPVTLLSNAIDPGHEVYEAFAAARRSAGLGPAEFDDTVILDPRWFAVTEHRAFAHDLLVTVPDLVDQLASRSYVLTMPDEQRAAVLGDARARFAARGSDTVLVRYRTTAIRARRARRAPSPERS